jgi:hypothetical protein
VAAREQPESVVETDGELFQLSVSTNAEGLRLVSDHAR